ncbi:hypothetical protein KEM48_000901 [Puccinia striiformis f. sp. tritici PST-130]|nr:hypothetical protein KEM48_000901 [Puccinia striiformis f. sp. tritici PST-130]
MKPSIFFLRRAASPMIAHFTWLGSYGTIYDNTQTRQGGGGPLISRSPPTTSHHISKRHERSFSDDGIWCSLKLHGNSNPAIGHIDRSPSLLLAVYLSSDPKYFNNNHPNLEEYYLKSLKQNEQANQLLDPQSHRAPLPSARTAPQATSHHLSVRLSSELAAQPPTALSWIHQIGYCHADFLLHRRTSGGTGTFGVKTGLAQMLKGGVIMDVVNAEQARIAEEAGACAVMALERVPSDIQIIDAVTIPVMAKARIGHFVEARILQAIGVDYIDESEVLTPADPEHHINKHSFKVPFVCGAKNLGEALRRISEGAAMIRTKGEAGTGNVVEAVRHERAVLADIRRAFSHEVARTKRLPVVNFAAGGIATPADAALMMQLGCDGVFVGSGIFKSDNPALLAKAIVQATTHHNNPQMLAEI